MDTYMKISPQFSVRAKQHWIVEWLSTKSLLAVSKEKLTCMVTFANVYKGVFIAVKLCWLENVMQIYFSSVLNWSLRKQLSFIHFNPAIQFFTSLPTNGFPSSGKRFGFYNYDFNIANKFEIGTYSLLWPWADHTSSCWTIKNLIKNSYYTNTSS